MSESLADIIRRESTPAFETLGALIAADEARTLADEEFDRTLWILVYRLVPSVPEDAAATVPKPVLDYYASRMVENDVGNGGFTQAAYNMPEWFDAAANRYEAIGHAAAAALIRRAYSLSRGETGIVAKLKHRRAGIGAIFRSFRESSLAELDDSLVDTLETSGWWATPDRVAYVRRNREAFLSLE